MDYEKQTFVDQETVLCAAHLEHIEDGIANAYSQIPKQVSWEDLQDKPFQEELCSSAYSFATPPAVTFDAMGYTWWKVSGLTPTREQALSAVFTFDVGTVYEQTPVDSEISLDTADLMGITFADGFGAGLAVCYTTGAITVDYAGQQLSMTVPETGVYFAYAAGATPPEGLRVGIEYNLIQKIDPKFLPDTAGGSGLPALTADDNGKILQAVDGVWSAVAVADSSVAAYVDNYINETIGGDY